MATPPAPVGPDFGRIDQQISTVWRDSVAWISQHSLEILVAALAGTIVVLALLGVRAMGLRICRRDAGISHWRTIFARAIARTSPWFMVVVAAKLVEGYARTPPAVSDTITFFFTIGAALQSAVWARELIIGFVEHRAGGQDERSSLGSALGLIRLLVTLTLFSVAALMILDNLGVNVTGLVAGLGIGGIAIGLAAKGIFDDLFSALSIIFDRPFRRGDAVRWDQTSGTVESIGLKTTRVRAVTGEEVVISNTNLLNKELHNLARLDRRRIILAVGITYETDPEVCAGIPDRIRGIVEAVDRCTLVRCGMVGFGASSLDFEIQFDVHSESFDELFGARSKVCIAILRDFNAAGISIAYPTQVTYTAAPDGRMVLPYPDVTVLATRPASAEEAGRG
jgi:small-conductance mechanosensitive channel